MIKQNLNCDFDFGFARSSKRNENKMINVQNGAVRLQVPDIAYQKD